MIDDSLLFQMGYLFPDIAISHVVISLFFGMLLSVLLTRAKRIVPPPDVPLPLPLIPQVDAPHFEERLALHIRALLAELFVPAHARAHTASEIARYAKGHPLIDILHTLEQSEYSSKPLSRTEREVMLEVLHTYGLRSAL